MNKTKTLAITGILTGMVFLLGMTPIGLIPLGFINLTIVHIPVIIGSMLTERKTSILLGLAFGIASTLAAFGLSLAAQSGLAMALLAYSPLAVIAMCIIPRILVPLVTRSVYDLLTKLILKNDTENTLKQSTVITISAILGSLTNTVFYLGLMGVFFYYYGIWGRFTAIFSVTLAIGALCEAIAAAVISSPVVIAVSKRTSYRKRYNKKSITGIDENNDM